ncbi:1644_t:CDS:2 [Diversispora eburnea]|uniref:1644_t:CDS:1 n=1 Tax=Diversispora eburnea TaxID=1213867 RepID=A0A9N8VSI6_9GLOM|nr:1644_t:CDS:2 [Diversispora eburnea]
MSRKSKEKVTKDDELLKNMKNYRRNLISFSDLLGSGRSGDVFAAKFHEKIGALKMVDLYKNESFAELGNNVTKEEKKLAILGLQEIHARVVRHGDVRLENIMVKRDELVGYNN